MTANLSECHALPRDEAFAITADVLADSHPNKVSLGAGVYRDENSKPWILPSVKAVSLGSSFLYNDDILTDLHSGQGHSSPIGSES